CRRQDLALQLRAGSGLFFKVWKLVPALRFSAIAVAGALAVGGICVAFATWDSPLESPRWGMTFGHAIVTLLLLVAASIVPVLKWLNPIGALGGYLPKGVVAFVGWIATNTPLVLFAPLYPARGRLRRLLRLK